MNIFIRQ